MRAEGSRLTIWVPAVAELNLVDLWVPFRSFDVISVKADMMKHVRIQEAHSAHTRTHSCIQRCLSSPPIRYFHLPDVEKREAPSLLFSVSVQVRATFAAPSGHKSVKWLGLHQQNSLLTLIHQCLAARHMQPFTLCDHLYTAERKLWESPYGYNHISRVRRWQHNHVLLQNVMILGVELRLNLFFFFLKG